MLVQTAKVAVQWTIGVLSRLAWMFPLPLLHLVIASTVHAGMRLLVLMLPLKVIFLAASPDVPGYLPWIGSVQRDWWVGGLAVGTLLAYVLMGSLGTALTRWTKALSRSVVSQYQDVALPESMVAAATRMVSDVIRLLSELLLVVCLVPVLWFLEPVLLLVIGGMPLCVLLVSSFLAQVHGPSMRAVFRWTLDNFRSYIGAFEVGFFFLAFGLIVASFLALSGGHVLAALATFILVRRLLNAIVSILMAGHWLVISRSVVDSLLDHEQSIRTGKGSPDAQELALWTKRERRNQWLTTVLGSGRVVESIGLRPMADHALRFTVRVDRSERDWLEAHVYPRKAAHRLARADLLFEQIAPEQVAAPRIVERRVREGVETVIYEAGSGSPPAKENWRAMQGELLCRLAAFDPPRALIDLTRRTTPALPDRLMEASVVWLEMATSNRADETALQRWNRLRPTIARRIRRQPVALFNPDLSVETVRIAIDRGVERPLLMVWGRWTLEPLAAVLSLDQPDRDVLRARWEHVVLARSELLPAHWSEHADLVAACWRFERALQRRDGVEGLMLLKKVLKAFGRIKRSRPEGRHQATEIPDECG